jgi:glycosyltransferase involved in cell wall biosynthesis
MIVKNEAHEKDGVPVIRRCLDSVGHLVDAIAIVDTGSQDNTMSIISSWAAKNQIPCNITIDPWRDDFGYSRTVALRRGEEFIEQLRGDSQDVWYFLFMDADNLAFADDGKSPFPVNKNRLTLDAYRVQMGSGSTRYGYIWMIRVDSQKKWEWYGPLHEYVHPVKDKITKKATWEAKYGSLEGGYIQSRREGSRSQDEKKYLRDAIVFEKALLEEPNNDRYLYYLAQSYRDAGNAFLQQSQETKENTTLSTQLKMQGEDLLKRAERAFHYRGLAPPFHLWRDEYTYYALLEAGRIRKIRKGGKADHKALKYFAKAHQRRPHRLEAPYHMLVYYRENDLFHLGWSLAKDLVRLPYPKEDVIFVDESVHSYYFIFEASLCAYYADAKEEFITLSKRVLRSNAPEQIKTLAKNNLANFGKLSR